MMPAWIYALTVVAVLWAVFVVMFHPFRRGAHAAPRALPVRVDAGSMVLAEEHTLLLTAPLLADQWPEPWQPGEHTSVSVWMSHGPKVDLRGVGSVAATAPLAPLGGQLGPRARAVLDGYNARCVERWGHAIAG